jgi:capsular exopolysaccharide synthesis family protein
MDAADQRSAQPPVIGFEDLLQLIEPSQPVGQSYESLMVNLQLLKRQPLKSVVFTSTQPEEGKTTVVVGLALAMARAHKRVLVVDADLRRPSIHRMLPVVNRDGLGAVLAGSAPPSELIQVVKIPANRYEAGCELGVITAGAPKNSSLFQAVQPAALSTAIENLARSFDLVLIDSPPILSVTDSLLLAPLADGVVLVLQSGAVAERDVLKAKLQLERAGGELLGVVMTHFDERLHGPSLHPYHAYYAANA